MTDADLLLALRDCYDPLLKRNIVDLNLIRSATLRADLEAPGANVPGMGQRYTVYITLTAPSADEAAAAQLQAQIENRLAGLPAVSRTFVTLLPPVFAILR